MLGFPSLRTGSINSLLLSANILYADATTVPVTQTWGVFDKEGNEVFDPDSFVSVGFDNSTKVVNYPVEQGGFESYNKVNNPSIVRVTLTKGGTESSRRALLEKIDKLTRKPTTYTIVTPYEAYKNQTLAASNYARTSESGANLLIIQLTFNEVRQVNNSSYTIAREGVQIKTKVPASALTNPDTATGLINKLGLAHNNVGTVSLISIAGAAGALQ